MERENVVVFPAESALQVIVPGTQLFQLVALSGCLFSVNS